MSRTRRYFVYILSSYSRAIYIGMTHNLQQRVNVHKQKLNTGFTRKYNIDRLVYFEEYNEVLEAIAREKQLKKWSRVKKDRLIEGMNPQWEDLAATR